MILVSQLCTKIAWFNLQMNATVYLSHTHKQPAHIHEPTVLVIRGWTRPFTLFYTPPAASCVFNYHTSLSETWMQPSHHKLNFRNMTQNSRSKAGPLWNRMEGYVWDGHTARVFNPPAQFSWTGCVNVVWQALHSPSAAPLHHSCCLRFLPSSCKPLIPKYNLTRGLWLLLANSANMFQ